MKYILFLLCCYCVFACQNNKPSVGSTALSAGQIQKNLEDTLKAKFTGSWANTKYGFTVTINSETGSYNGVAMGEDFHHIIKIYKIEGTNIFFTDDIGQSYTAQFASADKMILTKHGNESLIVVVNRVKI